jgi:nitrite reductase (NADH) small subunit
MTVPGERTGEVCLGPLETIPLGEGRAYCVAGERLAVFRCRSGSIFAVQSQCPHQQGPLAEGVAGGGAVICPLHAWKFDLETGACLNHPEHHLRTYPVRQVEGHLYVTLTDQ